jgi:hypothetical protein
MFGNLNELTSKMSSWRLKMATIGSPSKKLAKRLPAKQTTIEDSQQLSGWRREKAVQFAPKSSRTDKIIWKKCRNYMSEIDPVWIKENKTGVGIGN